MTDWHQTKQQPLLQCMRPGNKSLYEALCVCSIMQTQADGEGSVSAAWHHPIGFAFDKVEPCVLHGLKGTCVLSLN
jgi:hypothetical protein